MTMGSAAIVIAVVYTLLLSTSSVHGWREDVMCGHQQEVCTCSSTAQECYFELEVEELQTFTSYGLENGTIVTRGITGDTYYLNGSGFQPSLSDCLMPQRRLPECGGPCWSQNSNPVRLCTQLQYANDCRWEYISLVHSC